MNRNNLLSNQIHMPDEDRSLIDSFLSGSQDAFSRLLAKYQDLVYNVCYRLLEDPIDAEDGSQETFIKVYYGLKDFKFKSSFKTWLYRIAVNHCKNKLASKEYRRRRNMMELDKPIPTSEAVLMPELEDPGPTPEVTAIQKETTRSVLKAIGSLPTMEKTLIILCDLEGASYEEIAAITGLKLGTVKSKLARARHRLRGQLEGAI
jgi:RNA polymerase sigma-70 factor (ECF subfamily)